MRRLRLRPARGQAVVEMTLGVLVFVTVLIFGIHFAEVGYVSMKVQEAANFGLWAATSHRVHDLTNGSWNEWQTAVTKANGAVADRYPDFDGRSSQPGGGATLIQVFTEVTPIAPPPNQGTRFCDNDGTLPMVGATVAPMNAAGYPAGNSGVSCSASAVVRGYRLPQAFLEGGGGFFQADHYSPLDITVCAAGRATGASCNGRFGLMLDDWGLSGNTGEGENCLVLAGAGCANPGYYRLVESVYTAKGRGQGSAGSTLAIWTTKGFSPADENAFYMSFAGEDSPYGAFTDSIGSSHGQVPWETTPFTYPNGEYAASYGARTNCFLGSGC